jgi:ferrochelatase
MRYGNPGIEWAVNNLKHSGVKKIIAIPLYPQYAESSTGSSVHQLKKILKNGKDCEFRIIDKFYDNPDFIGALAQVGKKYRPEEYDHIIFSYHGLPERQIRKLSSYCQLNDWCCSSINEKNAYCYRAACFETTRQLVKKLNISEGKYTVSFQSRLNNKWLKPFTDKVIEEKAREEVKKLLVFAPAFVADCLETLYEIAVEYNEKFRKHGGEKIQMVESLNASEIWVNCLVKMVKEQN